jgi:hypothetical protein
MVKSPPLTDYMIVQLILADITAMNKNLTDHHLLSNQMGVTNFSCRGVRRTPKLGQPTRANAIRPYIKTHFGHTQIK